MKRKAPRLRLVLLPALLLAAVAAGFAGCRNDAPTSTPADDPAEPDLFRDVTRESGVNFTYRNGEEAGRFYILETLGGGVALFDYDGDGLLDIFLVGGGSFEGTQVRGLPNRLYKNLGGLKFKDVTAEVGLDRPLFYGHGCAVADFDRDGHPDLLVTGFGRVALYRNEDNGKGGRRFVEVTERAGLRADGWCTSAAWADLDGDGYPDLYICRYVDWSPERDRPCASADGKRRDICPPANFDAVPHLLYRNNGDGTFTDVSRAAGLRVTGPRKEFGKGLGVLAVDFNRDGRPELYVANDTTDKFLYLNRSKPGAIRLEEIGLGSGVARDNNGAANGSMGVAVGDYDRCGWPSIFVTNYEDELHALYRHERRADPLAFRFSAQAAGLGALGTSYVGWGAGFFDLENRGWENLFIANGHANFFPRGGGSRFQRPVLLHNEGDGRFRDDSRRGGPYFRREHNGRGVAFGDLDNDGKIDLVVSHLNEPVVLLRNEAGAGHHWLGVELASADHRDLVGARVVLEVGGVRMTRFHQGGGSYLSSGDRRQVFGLGDSTETGRLTVHWPSGRVQHWDGLPIDRYTPLVEGE
ncbi:MAG TPA: CRTAC1 family protein [Gemmataceae bacterium]|nr:CRTAC1 family protein [Gemmataceae bacterium]